MTEHRRTAVVTGVSSGIGRAIARHLINADWRVFGSVRKREDADASKQALGEAFTPLIFDVTDEGAIKSAVQVVEHTLGGHTLDALVNNAGVSSVAPLRYVSPDELQRVFDTNVFGALRVTQAFVRLLGGDHQRTGKPGKIINMSSASGRISVPLMGPYSMSKYALESMSDTLRIELRPHGIDVVIIEPGPVKTPIFEKIGATDVGPFEGTEYASAMSRLTRQSDSLSKVGLEPDELGKLLVRILNERSPRARYPIMKNRFMIWTLPRLMSPRLLDRVLARRSGLKTRKIV